MKLAVRNVILTVIAVAAGLLAGSPSRSAQPMTVTTNGVTVTLQSPRTGDVVSNTITLSADASSLAGPIKKVEFYVDGVLVSTVTNKFASPTNLFVY